MNFFGLLLASVVVVGFSLLAMAVGILIRNKSFSSCGCASITIRGEKIRCPGCTEDECSAPES